MPLGRWYTACRAGRACLLDESSVNRTRDRYCRVEQLAARVAHNHEVAGSSPAPANRSTMS